MSKQSRQSFRRFRHVSRAHTADSVLPYLEGAGIIAQNCQCMETQRLEMQRLQPDCLFDEDVAALHIQAIIDRMAREDVATLGFRVADDAKSGARNKRLGTSRPVIVG